MARDDNTFSHGFLLMSLVPIWSQFWHLVRRFGRLGLSVGSMMVASGSVLAQRLFIFVLVRSLDRKAPAKHRKNLRSRKSSILGLERHLPQATCFHKTPLASIRLRIRSLWIRFGALLLPLADPLAQHAITVYLRYHPPLLFPKVPYHFKLLHMNVENTQSCT